MTRFFKMSAGELREFEAVLSGGNFTVEDAKYVIENPSVILKIVELIKTEKESSIYSQMFNPVHVQVKLLQKAIADGDFPDVFSEEDLQNLLEKAQSLEQEDSLTQWVVVPYLETPHQTAEALWKLICKNQGSNWKWDEIEFKEKKFKLFEGITHPGVLLRLEKIDFGANHGESPQEVRIKNNTAVHPHSGILACAALNPEWIKKMDGDKVPFVWIIGYQLLYDSSWSFVLDLRFDQRYRRVELDALQHGLAYSGWSVPLLREYI